MEYRNEKLERGYIPWELGNVVVSLGVPNVLPGVKLLPIFESAIVVVTHKISHLHFPGTGPGDMIPLDDHIFQGGSGWAGTAQPPLQGL